MDNNDYPVIAATVHLFFVRHTFAVGETEPRYAAEDEQHHNNRKRSDQSHCVGYRLTYVLLHFL